MRRMNENSNQFDYIVIGAGSAGAAVANRLSADSNNRVLVIEAGGTGHFWSRIPIGYAKLIDNPVANWCYASEPDEGTGNRRIPVPRGKLLGGSSSINGNLQQESYLKDPKMWIWQSIASILSISRALISLSTVGNFVPLGIIVPSVSALALQFYGVKLMPTYLLLRKMCPFFQQALRKKKCPFSQQALPI